MIQVNDFKPGMSFKYEGNIFQVLDTVHNKTAMRQMIVKTKVKNLRTSAITDISFTGGDKVEPIHIDKRKMQYLYNEASNLVFMDMETYEQISVARQRLEWELKFLRENEVIELAMYEEEVVGINLPIKVTLKVTKTEPGVRGDTATRALKDAVLETGLLVKVPLFIEEGEELLIRTDTGDYDSRA